MSKYPSWMPPMLATLYKKEPFNDPKWLFEKKFDGVRCLAYFDGDNVKLMTRNQKKVNEQYPEIAQDVPKLCGKTFVVDGEIVVDNGKMGSFSKMQKRIGVKNPSESLIENYPLSYYVFDLLHLDGSDLRRKPLAERKKLLKQFNFTKRVHYTFHRNVEGVDYLKKMEKEEFEGAIAKEKNSSYQSSRSKKWLKLKCQNRQEMVIGGYTDPKGERIGFGALLIGFYEEGDLVYAGKVGTGYTDVVLKDMHSKLKRKERKTSPFDRNSPKKEQEVHWVAPDLVAEVEFTEWTSGNRLRHPAFVGLRKDKDPKKVGKEG